MLVCQGDKVAEQPGLMADDFKQIGSMNWWLGSRSECQRVEMSKWMDGLSRWCGEDEGDVYCDVCKPLDGVYVMARKVLSISMVRTTRLGCGMRS